MLIVTSILMGPPQFNTSVPHKRVELRGRGTGKGVEVRGIELRVVLN